MFKESYRERPVIFLIMVAVGAVLTAILVLAVNLTFDPLWYFSGNRVGDYNVRFNERVSKTNQFLKAPETYDCLIFGSSRVTLLNEKMIDARRCFNFSFSAGVIPEHIAYARYVKSWRTRPTLVIVGVEEFNFQELPELAIPDFVLAAGRPKPWVLEYLSFDALKLSIRVLKGGEYERQYTSEFIGTETRRVAQPEADQQWSDVSTVLTGLSSASALPEFDSSNVSLYRELRGVFPDAMFVGYVPPLSADRIVYFHATGRLESYLRSLHGASQAFDQFYDFSYPSEITLNPNNTFDGSHYYPEVNNLVVDRLLGRKTAEGFGIDVKAIFFETYYARYVNSVARIVAEKGLE